jgi:hypothetical protein
VAGTSDAIDMVGCTREFGREGDNEVVDWERGGASLFVSELS